MGLDSVRHFFRDNAPDIEILEKEASTATVAEAADAHGVEHGQIAKTLSFRVKDEVFLLVTRGDARLDNRKARAEFGGKVKMLDRAEVEKITGHPPGGVCPFGLTSPIRIFCDVSLRDFGEVIPAAGSVNAAVRIAPQRMAELTGASWVDVCQGATAPA